MSALLGKAGKKLFSSHLDQYAPTDPYYEYYTDKRGKKRRRRRTSPPGLSARDLKVLASVQHRAHIMDKGFSFCGLRFGWNFIIGLVPVAGDVADISLGYLLVIRKARQAELPPWLISRMMLNSMVSAGIGLVPGVGDVIVAVIKPNGRNAALLEEYLRIRGEEYLRMREGQAGLDVEQQIGEKVVGDGKEKTKAKKGKGKGKAADIKPGAGMKKGEVIPDRPNRVTATASGTLTSGATITDPSQVSLAKPATVSKNGSNKKSNGKFLFFGGSQRKAAPASGERGRFVENVSSTSSVGDVPATEKGLLSKK